MEIKNIVNLKDYPIDQTGSKEYQDLITKNRKLLDKDGCCVLPNFVLRESLKRMKEEVEKNLPKTHWTKDHHNPYFSKMMKFYLKIIQREYFHLEKAATSIQMI